MPDFSKLMQKPAGEAKRPPVLPADDYHGVISGAHELGESPQQKTPYVRFPVKLIDWGPSVPDSWEVYDGSTNSMVTVSKSDVDLAKRTFRADFYLTDDALFRLDEFIRSCGIESNGRSYEEVLPELVGRSVMVTLGQYTNKTSLEVGNQVNKLTGIA